MPQPYANRYKALTFADLCGLSTQLSTSFSTPLWIGPASIRIERCIMANPSVVPAGMPCGIPAARFVMQS